MRSAIGHRISTFLPSQGSGSHISCAAWPLRTADGEPMWNTLLSPFNIPDGGLEYPSDEEERQRGFDGKDQDIFGT